MAAPSSQLQPIAVVARVLDLSERQVYDLVRRGIIPRARPGKYDLFACIRAYVRHIREQAAGRLSKDGDLDIVAERARVAREQADGLAMKNAVTRQELVPAGDIEASRVAVHSAVVRRIRAVPRACALKVARENEARTCEAIIRRALDEALTDIANAEVVVANRAPARARDHRANRPN